MKDIGLGLLMILGIVFFLIPIIPIIENLVHRACF